MAETRRQELEGPSTRCGCIKGDCRWQRLAKSLFLATRLSSRWQLCGVSRCWNMDPWSKSTGRKIQLQIERRCDQGRSLDERNHDRCIRSFDPPWNARCPDASAKLSAQLARMAANGVGKIPPSPSYGNLAAGISATSLQIVVCNIISFNVWQLSSLLLVICCRSNSTQELSKLTVTVVVLLCSQTHFLSVWD